MHRGYVYYIWKTRIGFHLTRNLLKSLCDFIIFIQNILGVCGMDKLELIRFTTYQAFCTLANVKINGQIEDRDQNERQKELDTGCNQ